MSSPELLILQIPEQEMPVYNNKDGYGYWMNTPEGAQSFKDALPQLRNYGQFTELPIVVDELYQHKNLMLVGEPGAGKTHLVRDLQLATLINKVPAFCLSLHINAGKARAIGIENILPQIQAFTKQSKEAGMGLMILENIDFLAYKGKSRTLAGSLDYARRFKPILEEMVKDENIAVLGVAHDDLWREGRWTWQNEEINDIAQSVLSEFDNRLAFEGRMALEGLANVIFSRNMATTAEDPGISLGQATKLIQELDNIGQADFFHARHLDIDLFLNDPKAALDKINAGREARKHGKTTP